MSVSDGQDVGQVVGEGAARLDGPQSGVAAGSSNGADTAMVTIVAPRTPEGLSIVLKPHHGSRLYRVVPVRDLDQPRFWCLIVLRCSRAGAVEPDEDPWVISSGLTRDQIPPMLAEIQSDVAGWLAADSRQKLRAWLLQQLPDPLDVIRATNETRRRSSPEAEWEPGESFFPALLQELAPERT
jgi:hypothetical protein